MTKLEDDWKLRLYYMTIGVTLPYNRSLENAAIPDQESIVQAVVRLMEKT